MIESFVTVLNGVITGKHHGEMDADLFGTPYYGHEKVVVPFNAAIATLEPLVFYTPDWQRKPVTVLIDEGLIPMPQGHIREGDKLRPMTNEERVITGLDEPQPGHKVVNGKIVPFTMQEQLAAGQITQEAYEQMIGAGNTAELQRRLVELQTPEALAEAETNGEYAATRKAKLAALLAVKKQEGWPLQVVWPE